MDAYDDDDGVPPALKRHYSGPPVPDRKWLVDALKDKGLTQREAAKMLELKVASLNRSLAGGRRWQLTELLTFAEIVGKPFNAVMQRAGYKVPQPVVPVTYEIAGDRTLAPMIMGSPKYVPAPSEADSSTTAAVFATRKSELNAYNGGYIFFRPAHEVLAEAVGRLSIVALEGHRLPLLATIERLGLDAYEVTPFQSTEALQHHKVTAAAPVLWMRTA